MEQGKLYNFNSYSKTFYDGDDDALVMAIVNGKETPFIWAEDGLLKSKGVGILRRDSGEFVMPVFGAEKTDNGYVNMPDMPVIWDERGNCRASFHCGEYHAELFISDKENPRCFWSDSAAEGLYPCILSGVFSIGMLGRHYDRAKKTVTAMQIHPAGYPVVVHIEPCRLDIRWLVFMDRAAVSDIPPTPQDINKSLGLPNVSNTKTKEKIRYGSIQVELAAKIIHVLMSYSKELANITRSDIENRGKSTNWYPEKFPSRATIEALLDALKDDDAKRQAQDLFDAIEGNLPRHQKTAS